MCFSAEFAAGRSSVATGLRIPTTARVIGETRAGICSQAEESADTWFNGQIVMVGYEYPPGTETAPAYQWDVDAIA